MTITTIRSFVRRDGRVTSGQQRALDQLWPSFGINFSGSHIDWPAEFVKDQPMVLEIGFGMGEALVEMAQANPELNYVGIDIYRPGIGRVLAEAERLGLMNLRLMVQDAREVLLDGVADNSLEAIYVLFPDPWPKKKHHKRRIINSDFLKLVAQKLRPQGRLHVATDWAHYAEQIRHELEESELLSSFENFQVPHRYQRHATKFEQRGQRLGHEIWDFCAEKSS